LRNSRAAAWPLSHDAEIIAWTEGRKPLSANGLEQEYITSYSQEENGMIERFSLNLKQECVWLQRFEDRDHAFRVVADWLDRYHTERPHSALGYPTPKESGRR
jgi:transposase InsO family protein